MAGSEACQAISSELWATAKLSICLSQGPQKNQNSTEKIKPIAVIESSIPKMVPSLTQTHLLLLSPLQIPLKSPGARGLRDSIWSVFCIRTKSPNKMEMQLNLGTCKVSSTGWNFQPYFKVCIIHNNKREL